MKRKLRLYKRLWILLCTTEIVFLFLLGCLTISEALPKEWQKSPEIKIQAGVKRKEINEEVKEQKLSLIMVGDCLIHSSVYVDAKTQTGYDFNPMIENIKDTIKGYDLAFYNQESILGGEEIGLSSYPRFNSPWAVGDAFRNAGFNLVSLANNHTLDRGEQAIINSKNYWNQFPEVLTAGSYQNQEERNQIQIKEKNGIKYALLSYTDTTNGIPIPIGKEYLVNKYSEEQIKVDIEQIRDKVDLLLVSMHFGEEYTHTPTARQREISAYLASLGVDIVIGHHPHVIQPVEFINNTMVIYSLGNFISAQRGAEKLTGLMTSVQVTKTTSGQNTKIALEHPTVELVYTSSNIIGDYRNNFKLYRYQDLTDEILPGYKTYQEEFLNIATGGNSKIEAR